MFIDMTSSVWVSIIFATTDAGAAVDSFLRYYAAATAKTGAAAAYAALHPISVRLDRAYARQSRALRQLSRA